MFGFGVSLGTFGIAQAGSVSGFRMVTSVVAVTVAVFVVGAVQRQGKLAGILVCMSLGVVATLSGYSVGLAAFPHFQGLPLTNAEPALVLLMKGPVAEARSRATHKACKTGRGLTRAPHAPLASPLRVRARCRRRWWRS